MSDDSMTPARWPTRILFGIPIHALTMQEVLAIVDRAIERRDRLLIAVVNAAKLVNMRRDERLGQAVRRSDLILADGMSVVWASRLLRRSLPERVPGIDLMTHLLQLADERGHRVYCLGASEEVLTEVTEQIRRRYPGAVLAGARNGYYTVGQEEETARAIAAARPDLLFVGMTSPKKERFLATWSAVMAVPVCHGVGGAFDVMAGRVRRAPQLWQRLGLEWLYRVVQEPRRMWRRYLVTNTWFCGMLLRELFKRRRSYDVPVDNESPGLG